MKLESSNITEERLANFQGGEGDFIAKITNDGLNKIIFGKLEPGCSIGYHKHETSSEIIYIIEGCGKMIVEDGEESLKAGDAHYCPKGSSHSLVNNSDAMLSFFAVIPQQ